MRQYRASSQNRAHLCVSPFTPEGRWFDRRSWTLTAQLSRTSAGSHVTVDVRRALLSRAGRRQLGQERSPPLHVLPVTAASPGGDIGPEPRPRNSRTGRRLSGGFVSAGGKFSSSALGLRHRKCSAPVFEFIPQRWSCDSWLLPSIRAELFLHRGLQTSPACRVPFGARSQHNRKLVFCRRAVVTTPRRGARQRGSANSAPWEFGSAPILEPCRGEEWVHYGVQANAVGALKRGELRELSGSSRAPLSGSTGGWKQLTTKADQLISRRGRA
ncbi:hypothetical protein SRHO_G00329440 [Serrasalmus rhombeus]